MCRLPKQYPAVPAMTWPPRPALWTSLIRPPVPVVAPLNGATPTERIGKDGKLIFGKHIGEKDRTDEQIILFSLTSWEVVCLCGEDDMSQ